VSATVHNLADARRPRTDTVDWTIPLVGRKQLADHLGFSPTWVSQQVAKGAPHFRMGGSLRFQIPTFVEWVMDQEAS
jgi:hypothetical protein